MTEAEAIVELAKNVPVAIATLAGLPIHTAIIVGGLFASIFGYTEARRERKRNDKEKGDNDELGS